MSTPGIALPGASVPSGSLTSPGGAQGIGGVSGVSGDPIPIGATVEWGSLTAPSGWLICDGSSYATSLYPALFALIGYNFGGSGANFNVPDKRGRVGIGAGQGAGLTNRVLAATGGEETHQLSIAELASHTHIQNAHNHDIGNQFQFTTVGPAGGWLGGGPTTGNWGTVNATATNQNTGSNGAHNTMQPFVVVAYIIKASSTGGATAQAPIADSTQDGLLRKVSGLVTDYVGGDNNCHPLPVSTPQIWTPDQNGLLSGSRNRKQLYDDFTYYFNAGAAVSASGTQLTVWPFTWFTFISGTGAIVQISTTAGRDSFNRTWGVWATSNGNTATGRAGFYDQVNTIVPGLGALDIYCRIAFAALPTSANSTVFRVGLGDAGFAYVNLINLQMSFDGDRDAPVWLGWTQSASVGSGTTPVTSPTIISNTGSALCFYKLKISINAAWNSVTFYVNGVNIGTITTNIPLSGAVYPCIMSDKNSGNSANGFYVDDFALDYQYAVP